MLPQTFLLPFLSILPASELIVSEDLCEFLFSMVEAKRKEHLRAHFILAFKVLFHSTCDQVFCFMRSVD